jgi:hypothetical protein
MAFMTEAEYFAGRADLSRTASLAATDPAVTFAHGELARCYDVSARRAREPQVRVSSGMDESAASLHTVAP